MTAGQTRRTPGAHRLLALISLCSAAAGAQNPPLAPTIDTTIVVPAGVLHYSSINIPAGVTVKFVAPGYGPLSTPGMPALILCDGDAIVHGTLSLAGDIVNDRPAGWVTAGEGSVGISCASAWSRPPGGGRHAGTYGSVLPFSLDGGSCGGMVGYYTDPGCTQFSNISPGGEGGGTLALITTGRIEVHGTVTADGIAYAAGGSGGSILLRASGGLTVLPGGTVTALGAIASPLPPPYQPQFNSGAPGYIRLDAWGAQPNIQGMVTPTPMALELPYLHQVSLPRIGATWALEVFAPENTPVVMAASLNAGSGAPTPFGPLGIDPIAAAAVGVAAAQPSHDPVATFHLPIPNAVPLIGLGVWMQALAAPVALPARLTNTLPAVLVP